MTGPRNKKGNRKDRRKSTPVRSSAVSEEQDLPPQELGAGSAQEDSEHDISPESASEEDEMVNSIVDDDETDSPLLQGGQTDDRLSQKQEMLQDRISDVDFEGERALLDSQRAELELEWAHIEKRKQSLEKRCVELEEQMASFDAEREKLNDLVQIGEELNAKKKAIDQAGADLEREREVLESQQKALQQKKDTTARALLSKIHNLLSESAEEAEDSTSNNDRDEVDRKLNLLKRMISKYFMRSDRYENFALFESKEVVSTAAENPEVLTLIEGIQSKADELIQQSQNEKSVIYEELETLLDAVSNTTAGRIEELQHQKADLDEELKQAKDEMVIMRTNFDGQILELTDKNKQLEQQAECAQKRVAQLEEENEDCRQQIDRLNIALNDMHTKATEIETKLKAQAEVATAEIEKYKAKISEYDNLDMSPDTLKGLEQRLKAAESENREIQTKLDEANARLVEVETQYAERFAEQEAGYKDCVEQLSAAEEELKTLSTNISDKVNERDARIREIESTYKAETEKLEAALRSSEAQCEEFKQLIETQKRAEADQSRATATLESQINSLTQTLECVNQEADGLRNEVRKLQAEQKAYNQKFDAQKESQDMIINQLEKQIDEYRRTMELKDIEMEEVINKIRTQITEKCEQQNRKSTDILQKRLNGSNRAIIELETEMSQKNLQIQELIGKIDQLERSLEASVPPPITPTRSGFFGLF